jgi:hypothetical protein
VVAVDGMLAGQDTAYFALDVAAGTAADRARLKSDLTKSSKGLDADRDPSDPANYYLVPKSDRQETCDSSGCTESEAINADDGDQRGNGYLVGIFAIDKSFRHVLGTCQTRIPAIRSGKSIRVSCGTHSLAWQSFADGSYWFRMAVFSPGWDGDGPSLLIKVLPKLRNTDPGSGVISPAESLALLYEMLNNKGWSADDASQAVKDIDDANLLGPVQKLMAERRLTLNPDTFSAQFKAGQAPYFREALRLADAGSKHVAVDSWKSAGEVYSGDVFDIDGKKRVMMGMVDGASMSSSVQQIADTVGRSSSASAPTGFTREVRLLVSPRSPLYRFDRAALRTELRNAGVRASTVEGAGSLVIVTGAGTYTYHQADFR